MKHSIHKHPVRQSPELPSSGGYSVPRRDSSQQGFARPDSWRRHRDTRRSPAATKRDLTAENAEVPPDRRKISIACGLGVDRLQRGKEPMSRIPSVDGFMEAAQRVLVSVLL